MSRVKELDEQIKKLLEEKERVFSTERATALADVKEKIATFGFTPKELGMKLAKAVDGRKPNKEAKIASKKSGRKVGKKAVRKSKQPSGQYFDLGGKHVAVGTGRPRKEVTAYAIANGVTTDSLKRNADGSPVVK